MSSRVWWLGLCLAIVIPRAYLAVSDQGMVWSDEIFQTLEQGHRLAFGYGLVPWEFKQGARSWILPATIAGVMKIVALVGVKTGLGLAVAIKTLFAVIAAATFYPLLRMAEAMAGRFAAVLLAALAVVFPALLLYGARAMTESATAPLLAWSAWLLFPLATACVKGRPEPSTDPVPPACPMRVRRIFFAGILLGLAAVLRYQNMAAIVAILAIVAARRQVRAALWLTLAMAMVLLAGGVLDWLTWGKFFQSLIVYVRFNLVEGGANHWGVAARDFYWRALWETSGPVLSLLLVGFVAGLRRSWPVALPVLVFVVAHSAISHKELRFIYPVLPLFLLCAAVGLASILPLWSPWRVLVAGILVIALPAAFVIRSARMTFADIGQSMPAPEAGGPTAASVWRAFDERNRLLSEAGSRADLCGLSAPGMIPYWTGGYTYFHRQLPIVWSDGRADAEAANYVLTGPGRRMTDPRFAAVARRGPYVLFRRDGSCGRASIAGASYGRLSPQGVPLP